VLVKLASIDIFDRISRQSRGSLMLQTRRRFQTTVVALLLSAGILAPPSVAAQETGKLTIFAAASLKTALDAANAAYRAETGTPVTVSYAASSALAKQIEAGAPADIFISADLDWMDYLASKALIRTETRSNILGNRLVLIAPKDGAKPIGIRPGFDLAGLLAGGRLAMGAVDSVPAGRYGKAALQTLGIWKSVEERVAGAENVRAALALVSRGEAPYGIVYETDAAAEPGVAVVGTFPQDTHPPIIYPAAVLAGSSNALAKAYLDFLKSDRARPFFVGQGFTVLK
jgi:molybdate transport system substrate-binding protein